MASYRKIKTAVLCAILAAMSVPVHASEADRTAAVIDPSRTGTVAIDYKDDSDGYEPVSGAGFTFYKVAKLVTAAKDAGGGAKPDSETFALPSVGGVTYKSLIAGAEVDSESDPEQLREAVETAYKGEVKGGAAYSAVTDASGAAEIAGMDQGVYLGVETKAAEDHIQSTPFLVSVPWSAGSSWNYSQTVEPKSVTAGSLVIKKTVTGAAGDRTRAFTFKVTLDQDGTYVWTKSDGTTGALKSGDTISLRHGETVTIDTIESGTTYTVTEEEANKDGYKTTSDNSSGHISYKKEQKVTFVNDKGAAVPTPSKKKKKKNSSGGSGDSRRLNPVRTGDDTNIYYTVGEVLAAALVIAAAVRKKAKEKTGKQKTAKRKR